MKVEVPGSIWLLVFFALVAIAILSLPWGLLAIAVIAFCGFAYSRSSPIYEAARGPLLAAAIGLGLCCAELSILRATGWLSAAHDFEVGLVRLHYRLEGVNRFFSLKHTVVLLIVFFTLELLFDIRGFAAKLVKLKNGLSLAYLTVSIAFSLSCFALQGPYDFARDDNDNMNKSYDLAIRDWKDAAADVAAVEEITDTANSPDFDVSSIIGIDRAWARGSYAIRQNPNEQRKVLAGVVAHGSWEAWHTGVGSDKPNRPTTRERLFADVEHHQALPEPSSLEERAKQLESIKTVTDRARKLRKMRGEAIGALKDLVIDKAAEIGAGLTADESSLLYSVLEQIVSGFADVFWDKTVDGWLRQNIDLTADTLRQKAAAIGHARNVAVLYLKAAAKEIGRMDIEKIAGNISLNETLGRDREKGINWPDMERLETDPYKVADARAAATRIVNEEKKEEDRVRGKGKLDPDERDVAP